MKIALVNYRYFVSGGPERYMFAIQKALEKRGHQVYPFSVKSVRNQETPTESYFLSSIGQGHETYFSEYNLRAPRTLTAVLGRMFYSFEAKKCFRRFLKAFTPDIVYVLHYQNKISCSIIDEAWAQGIPVVQRISDFGHVCATAHLYDNKAGKVCEKCIQGPMLHGLGGCMGCSLPVAALKVGSLYLQKWLGMRKKIRGFVFPSRSTLGKYVQAGFAPESCHHIPTFFNEQLNNPPLPVTYGDYALYIGRLTPEKGLNTLIASFLSTKLPLKIVGFGVPAYEAKLKAMLEGQAHRIEFLGRLDFSAIKPLLAECLFTVVPSEWYDNFPNTVLESFAFSKCVVASNYGSLVELVEDGKTGLVFPAGDSQALAAAQHQLFADAHYARQLGEAAQRKLEELFSEKRHVDALESLFQRVTTTAS